MDGVAVRNVSELVRKDAAQAALAKRDEKREAEHKHVAAEAGD